MPDDLMPMPATAEPHAFALAQIPSFFAPVPVDQIEDLLARHAMEKGRIEALAALFTDELRPALTHFIKGNIKEDGTRYSILATEKIFCPVGAMAHLDATYWQKALDLTDVYQAMPQKRRDEWNESLRSLKAPRFEPHTVRATLNDLLIARAGFFAERIDGIFRSLSGRHVTNSPGGFNERMIIDGLVTPYGTTHIDRVGYINDLRCVIAKFNGTDEPRWNASSSVVEHARTQQRGEWVTLDGGALRLRAYKCGTAHLEVHPELAWRLNGMLSYLYPQAIPTEHRQPPRRKPKDIPLMMRPLPFAIRDALLTLREALAPGQPEGRRGYEVIPNTRSLLGGEGSKAVIAELRRILTSLGGVMSATGNYYQFDYNPTHVIREIAHSGCIPDQQSHQFYPTPDVVAQAAVRLAELGPDLRVLEPSAGLGALADAALRTGARITCVEVSPMYSDVLRQKHYEVHTADFLAWTPPSERFDRVLMNPPFSEGRWQAHLAAAASCVAPGGRLTAILPASASGKDLLPGWKAVRWQTGFDNLFEGTQISVAIFSAQAPE